MDILKYKAIESGAPIILGGGGLVANPFFQRPVEALAEMPNPLFAWGIGHNDHTYKPGAEIHYPEWLRKCMRVGLRDRNNPYAFVPCSSCMSPLFDHKRSVRWPVGIYEHRSVRTIPASVKAKAAAFLQNSCKTLDEALDFLGACEVVVTNTYHGMYWSVLLGKPTIVFPYSSRFYLTPFEVEFQWSVEKASDKASHYAGLLDQYRTINAQFHNQILSSL